MKLLRFSSHLTPFVALALRLSAQTLFVPSGTSGIGSSSTGNVGIGTASPSSPFTLQTSAFYSALISGTGSYGAGLHLESQASGARYQIQAIGTAVSGREGNFEVQNYNTGYVALTVTNGGNVGIGTTSPGAKLEVSGSTNGFQNALNLTNTSNGTSAVNRIQLGNDASPGTGQIVVYGSQHSSRPNYVNVENAGPYPLLFGTNDIERVRIDSVGNVGIGTSSPGEKLEVAGNIKLSSATITNGVRALIPTGWGYSPNTYRVVQVGASSGSETVAIGYDPSGNPNGSFSGDGREVLFRNGVQFVTPNAANNAFNLSTLVLKDGNVGVGTTNPTQKLSVNGTIRAKEVIVDTGWSDYVFKPDYRLATLSEIEGAIQRDGHLPGIPSAQEVAEHGITVGEMQSKLLAKIEELTLHVIAQEKHQLAQEQRIEKLEAENTALRAGRP